MLYAKVDSPIGPLLLWGDGDALHGLSMQGARAHSPQRDWVRDDAAFDTVAKQLRDYFAGDARVFDIVLGARGTGFQQRVWNELVRIPYGETATYGEIAERIGMAGAARAVGHANARNPIAIVVPCHRVIGASGTLTGYAYGVERKQHLLALERGVRASQQQLDIGASASASTV
jgi:methylated-DNA-[protein]-cysteine S-methyltransferase